MADLEHEARVWADWIKAACDSVGVDPALVDVTAIHDLSRVVAREVIRPMAPVSTFILGAALAVNPDVAPQELLDKIAQAHQKAE